jgi:hypothetical protein
MSPLWRVELHGMSLRCGEIVHPRLNKYFITVVQLELPDLFIIRFILIIYSENSKTQSFVQFRIHFLGSDR